MTGTFKRQLGEEMKKYKLPVIKQSWDVKDGIGNIVDTVITVYGVRWVLDESGAQLHKCLSRMLY